MKRLFLRGDSKTHSLQKVMHLAVSQMVASSEKPSASRKSGKSPEGASSSQHASPDSPWSPKATVSAPQAKNFHAAEGGGPLREAQPFLDGFGRSFYVAASPSHDQAIGAVFSWSLINGCVRSGDRGTLRCSPRAQGLRGLPPPKLGV